MLRDHLRAAERATGRRIPRLHRRCPPAAQRLWAWFLQLHRTRHRTESGPCPLSYTEVEAWSRLNQVPLQPREIDVLMAVDNVYFEVRAAHG